MSNPPTWGRYVKLPSGPLDVPITYVKLPVRDEGAHIEALLYEAIKRCAHALNVGFFCPHSGEVRFSVAPDQYHHTHGTGRVVVNNPGRGWRVLSVPMDIIRAAHDLGRDEAVQRVVRVAIVMGLRDV